MSKIFKAKVNNTFDFEFAENDISNLDSIKLSDADFHIIQQHKSYKAEITNADFNTKTYQIKINNNNYKVNIINALELLIEKIGFSIGTQKHINFVKAPMPGLILGIHVNIGQEIKENDPLLILVAMKMENNILSPRAGVIKTISAVEGDAVEKNQILIEFE
ncbi:acetyl-CoA carboxylase biotin carboxyl carrier protein subunit [Yeosuana sp.]|uniref:acetyl-CoA carboxylase biotin carboxyl carrier protein subunit n=1 Tax=Yeosuana sp. TaxID=2529388 RepID=UPI004054F4D9